MHFLLVTSFASYLVLVLITWRICFPGAGPVQFSLVNGSPSRQMAVCKLLNGLGTKQPFGQNNEALWLSNSFTFWPWNCLPSNVWQCSCVPVSCFFRLIAVLLQSLYCTALWNGRHTGPKEPHLGGALEPRKAAVRKSSVCRWNFQKMLQSCWKAKSTASGLAQVWLGGHCVSWDATQQLGWSGNSGDTISDTAIAHVQMPYLLRKAPQGKKRMSKSILRLCLYDFQKLIQPDTTPFWSCDVVGTSPQIALPNLPTFHPLTGIEGQEYWRDAIAKDRALAATGSCFEVASGGLEAQMDWFLVTAHKVIAPWSKIFRGYVRYRLFLM